MSVSSWRTSAAANDALRHAASSSGSRGRHVLRVGYNMGVVLALERCHSVICVTQSGRILLCCAVGMELVASKGVHVIKPVRLSITGLREDTTTSTISADMCPIFCPAKIDWSNAIRRWASQRLQRATTSKYPKKLLWTLSAQSTLECGRLPRAKTLSDQPGPRAGVKVRPARQIARHSSSRQTRPTIARWWKRTREQPRRSSPLSNSRSPLSQEICGEIDAFLSLGQRWFKRKRLILKDYAVRESALLRCRTNVSNLHRPRVICGTPSGPA